MLVHFRATNFSGRRIHADAREQHLSVIQARIVVVLASQATFLILLASLCRPSHLSVWIGSVLGGDTHFLVVKSLPSVYDSITHFVET
jgi:hypothetical protein